MTQFEMLKADYADCNRERARWRALAEELLAALQAEEEWRAREAAGALDDEWDYETLVGNKRRAALSKVQP